MSDSRKPFRVTLPNGLTTVLLLTPETAARDYPNAVETKLGPVPVVKDAPKKKPVARKRTTTK